MFGLFLSLLKEIKIQYTISKHEKEFSKTLAIIFFYMYNVECWSLTAMMREVTDTPGRFAMAGCWKIFVENV